MIGAIDVRDLVGRPGERRSPSRSPGTIDDLGDGARRPAARTHR